MRRNFTQQKKEREQVYVSCLIIYPFFILTQFTFYVSYLSLFSPFSSFSPLISVQLSLFLRLIPPSPPPLLTPSPHTLSSFLNFLPFLLHFGPFLIKVKTITDIVLGPDKTPFPFFFFFFSSLDFIVGNYEIATRRKPRPTFLIKSSLPLPFSLDG